MLHRQDLVWFTVALVAGMAVTFQVGRMLGARYQSRTGEKHSEAYSSIANAVFALMSLLMAFTFYGADARLDVRRTMAVTEASAIGTAYQRLDLLPAAHQPRLRQEFRDYLDSRIATEREFTDEVALRAALARSDALQQAIWTHELAALQESPPLMVLVVPALNQMFDITAARTATLFTHPPRIIYFMLALVLLTCTLLMGFQVATSPISLVHILCFIGLAALTIFVTLNLEFPRISFLPIDLFDRLLIDLRHELG
jgi:hypothetical protein